MGRAIKCCETGARRLPGPGWVGRPRGATAVEYLVILILAVLVLLGALQIFGNGIVYELDRATTYIATIIDEDARGMSGESRRGQDSLEDDTGGASHGDREDRVVTTEGSGGRDSQPIRAETQREETTGSVGGVNPLIILLVILGIIASGYFMFGDSD